MTTTLRVNREQRAFKVRNSWISTTFVVWRLEAEVNFCVASRDFPLKRGVLVKPRPRFPFSRNARPHLHITPWFLQNRLAQLISIGHVCFYERELECYNLNSKRQHQRGGNYAIIIFTPMCGLCFYHSCHLCRNSISTTFCFHFISFIFFYFIFSFILLAQARKSLNNL